MESMAATPFGKNKILQEQSVKINLLNSFVVPARIRKDQSVNGQAEGDKTFHLVPMGVADDLVWSFESEAIEARTWKGILPLSQ
ncbi:hypothetical protein R1flu_027675 [Riccia fluitans]|uniref:Uncharacterized protein n=1 Tax=Riccia fluitans TaxID=41844 RepID=A0ABD1XJI3_9MARC